VSDEDQISEMLYQRDLAAFAVADWSLVEADFDSAAFVGHRLDRESGHWQIAYPDLGSYRDEWLRQAEAMRSDEPATATLAALSRIADVSIDGQHALVRKEFDGTVEGPDGPVELAWTTYYFLRRRDEQWRITGFVGYLPHADGRWSVP
jgi:hypothetical protein